MCNEQHTYKYTVHLQYLTSGYQICLLVIFVWKRLTSRLMGIPSRVMVMQKTTTQNICWESTLFLGYVAYAGQRSYDFWFCFFVSIK